MKELAFFRFKLLLKQKLGWGVLVAAVLYFPFALFLAYSSYVRPEKIYFDLATGFCFIVATLLSTYLGSHLYQEESQRKTLSFVLTLRSSRAEWLFANWLGLSAMIGFSIIIWTLLLSLGAFTVTQTLPPLILFQAQLFLFFEAILILATSLLFSLFLKPLLSWFAVLALIALMHSKSYLELLVVESGFTGVTKLLYSSVLFVLNFLPPLEWWDIRMFVSFHDPLNWEQLFIITALTGAWTYILLLFARLKWEIMDL